MFLKKKLLTTTLAFLFVFSMSSASYADGMPDETENSAQNAPVKDISPEDILNTLDDSLDVGAEKDGQSAVVEEKVPTITAQGDFVVPTYVTPPVEADSNQKEPAVRVEDVQTQVETVQTLPVVKITQTELVPVSEQMAVERFLTGKTTQTMKAYKEALARQQGESASEETAVDPVDLVVDNVSETERETSVFSADEDMEGRDGVTRKRLLLPLKPSERRPVEEEDLSGTEPMYKVVPSSMADSVLAAAKTGEKNSALMPMDVKVTFYPNSTEFSGQTVKWIKAFSLRALNDPRYVVEVRVSRENPAIQQKRLFVVQRLLMNSGLSIHQIAIDYVNRPVDSMVLRMVQRADDVQIRKIPQKSGRVRESKTINW